MLVGVLVVGIEVGSEVGAGVGHAVPIEFAVVTCQPLTTVLERAATSVGIKPQIWFDAQENPAVIGRFPSWLGSVEDIEFAWIENPLLSASIPSWDGVSAVSRFEARLGKTKRDTGREDELRFRIY